MAIENGIDIKRARNDVISVPTRKGSAPNVSDAASQVFAAKKKTPNWRIDGTELTKSVASIPRKRTIINPPLNARMILNDLSERSICRVNNFVCLVISN